MKKRINSFSVVLTWEYEDGSWNTEILEQDVMPKKLIDYFKYYEKSENEEANK